MGGEGSGRFYRWDKKRTVDDSLQFSLKCLTTHLKQLTPGSRGTGSLQWTRGPEKREYASIAFVIKREAEGAILTLKYLHNAQSNPEHIEYQIPLVTTVPTYGGLRWWFICPGRNCGRRVAILYSPGSSKYFLCRHCHDLTYRSCQESHKFDRLFAHIAKQTGYSVERVKQVLR